MRVEPPRMRLVPLEEEEEAGEPARFLAPTSRHSERRPDRRLPVPRTVGISVSFLSHLRGRPLALTGAGSGSPSSLPRPRGRCHPDLPIRGRRRPGLRGLVGGRQWPWL